MADSLKHRVRAASLRANHAGLLVGRAVTDSYRSSLESWFNASVRMARHLMRGYPHGDRGCANAARRRAMALAPG